MKQASGGVLSIVGRCTFTSIDCLSIAFFSVGPDTLILQHCDVYRHSTQSLTNSYRIIKHSTSSFILYNPRPGPPIAAVSIGIDGWQYQLLVDFRALVLCQ